MRIIYVLPKPHYFAEGPCGRVTHAASVADGLAAIGVDVLLLSGPDARRYVKRARVIEIETERGWLAALQRRVEAELDAAGESTVVIIRYGVSNAIRFVPLMRRRRDVHWCFEVNSLGYHQRPDLPAPLRRAMLAIERRIVNRADSCYLISEEIRSDLAGRDGDDAARKYLVVPNGGPEPERPGGSHSGSPPRFEFFGIYHPYYDLGVVLEGFRRARSDGLEASLHFHGDGPQKALVSEAASEAGSHVHVHGRYDFAELVRAELDPERTVLLLPLGGTSDNRVRSPIKLFEYMSVGLPIIASRVPAITRVLASEDSALLVDPADPDAWAEAMRLVADEPARRASLVTSVRAEYPPNTWKRRMGLLRDLLRARVSGGVVRAPAGDTTL